MSLARGLPVLSISIGDSADMLYGEGPDEVCSWFQGGGGCRGMMGGGS